MINTNHIYYIRLIAKKLKIDPLILCLSYGWSLDVRSWDDIIELMEQLDMDLLGN